MDDEVREIQQQAPITDEATLVAGQAAPHVNVPHSRDWREADMHNHQLEAAIRDLQARMTRVEDAVARLAQHD